MATNRRLPSYQVISSVLRTLEANDTAGARAMLTRADLDLADIRAHLEKSRLSGYFYILVSEMGLTDMLQPDMLEQLAAAHRRQVGKNQAHLALLTQLQQGLEAASVPFVTLKGLYLAQRFFGDMSRRFMSDIDILVRPRDLETALHVAAQMGLHPTSRLDVDARNPLWGIHAVEVQGEAGALDIHHAIRKLPGIEFDYTRIWRHTREFSVDGISLVTLDDFDTLLVAAIGLGADLQNSHHNLRKIWDIYTILRQLDETADWDAFFQLRVQEGCLKLIANVFAFCLNLVGTQQDCPRLRQAMAAYRPLLLIHDAHQAERVFTRARQNLANRLLFSRLLPISPLGYWLRWLATLPVRVWHYRRTAPAS